jgi:hypothetical protein
VTKSLIEDPWKIEESALPLVDRSTLELYSTCPMQARLMESGKAIRESELLNVGIDSHDVLSIATAEYVGSHGDYRAPTLSDVVLGLITTRRPDVTTRVHAALKPSIWAWSAFLCDMHWDNILRFDGGQGERSGQLALDLEYPGVRVTSELDLLYAGPSPEILHEVDYKSGFKQWTEDEIKHSLQFQLHAVLVFEKYPDVQCLEVIVWDTRLNHRTFRVRFYRRDEPIYRGRVVQAAVTWAKHRLGEPTKVPTWPEAEKCAACPVSQHCPRCAGIETDPVELLRSLIVLESARANVMKQLSATVKRTGQDVVTPEGDAFGKHKPPSNRAKPNAIYSTKSNDCDEDPGD